MKGAIYSADESEPVGGGAVTPPEKWLFSFNPGKALFQEVTEGEEQSQHATKEN